jgi:hypothetical protein
MENAIGRYKSVVTSSVTKAKLTENDVYYKSEITLPKSGRKITQEAKA